MAEQLELDVFDVASREQILEDQFYNQRFQTLEQEAPDAYIPPISEMSNGIGESSNPYDDSLDNFLNSSDSLEEEQTFVQEVIPDNNGNDQRVLSDTPQGPWAFEYIVFQDADNSNTPVAVLASNYRFDNPDGNPDHHLYAMHGIYAKNPEGAVRIYEDRELYKQHPTYTTQPETVSVIPPQAPDIDDSQSKPDISPEIDDSQSDLDISPEIDDSIDLSPESTETQVPSTSDELKASAVATVIRDYSLNALDPKTGQKMTSTIGVVRVPKSKEGIENVPVFESRAFPQSNLQHSFHKDINDEALNWIRGQFRRDEVSHTFTNVKGEHLGVKYTATQVNDFNTGKYVLNVAYGDEGERTYQHIGEIAAVQNKLLDFGSKQPPINQFFAHLAQQKAPHISEDGKLNLAIR
jgi:hypothetical protein